MEGSDAFPSPLQMVCKVRQALGSVITFLILEKVYLHGLDPDLAPDGTLALNHFCIFMVSRA